VRKFRKDLMGFLRALRVLCGKKYDDCLTTLNATKTEFYVKVGAIFF
jgi:hypothetical protein